MKAILHQIVKNLKLMNLVGVYDNLRKHHDQIIFDWQVTANENKLRNHILLLNVQFFGHLFDVTSKQIPEFLVKNVSLHEGDFAPDC
jgi:hypothetical protein